MKSSGRTVCTLHLGAAVIVLILSLAATNAAVRVDSLHIQAADLPRYETLQQGGKTLEEAIDWVRSQSNVARIIDANTRVSGGREVHHIKVLTKDGVIRIYKIPGRKLG
jgi:hypothetical protein